MRIIGKDVFCPIPCGKNQTVPTSPSVYDVIAGITGSQCLDVIVPRAAIDGIGAWSRGNIIIARAAIDVVIRRITWINGDGIITFETEYGLGATVGSGKGVWVVITCYDSVITILKPEIVLGWCL